MLANSKTVTSLALTLNWKITLLGLCFLPLLFRLGFWQVERADEKRQLLEHASIQWQLPPVPIFENNIPIEKLQKRRVIVSGVFLPGRYWLLDNRVFRGKVGYQVIAPVLTNDDQTVLVNRGWVQAPLSRQQLPVVAFPSEEVTMHGRWKLVEENSLIRDVENGKLVNADWPIRIQEIDFLSMQKELGQKVSLGYLQINPEDSQALQTDWKNINVMPEKHMGYAVQWFSMTLALAIALIFANTNLAVVLGQAWRQRKPSPQ